MKRLTLALCCAAALQTSSLEAQPSPQKSSPGPAAKLAPADDAGPRNSPGTALPSAVCEPAHPNLERAASDIVQAARPPAPVRKWKPWNHKSRPQYLPRMTDRFALTRVERRLLYRHGFVVPARLEVDGYAVALHELYQSQLPIYISADAILHALYKGTDTILGSLETLYLLPLTQQTVERLRQMLPTAGADYPGEVAGDLDVYLTVAQSLLEDTVQPSSLGNDALVAKLFAQAREARGIAQVELFGRQRMVDFSQYQPRGRYGRSSELQPYFRGAMWLSRLELNLVSRSSRSSAPGLVPDPRETPREALVALALADLAQQSGQLDNVAKLDTAWATMCGQREDVTLHDLAKLRRQAQITSLQDDRAFFRLKAAIGNRSQRRTRMHWMPQGAKTLPVIFTLLGPRAVPDAQAVTTLVHDQLHRRFLARAADVVYLLGHRAALRHLKRDLGRYPALLTRLKRGQVTLGQPGPGLYGAWLEALRALASAPDDAAPSFMRGAAFADLRTSSLVAGYAQLRQSHVLVAAQAYDAYGCEVPDGFVDPVPELYAALGRYADRARRWSSSLNDARATEYFSRVGWVLSVLQDIARDELAGRPLSEAARQWLSMVAEIQDGGCDRPPAYNGWYFSLFPEATAALEDPALIADFFTSTNLGKISYVGAQRPRLALFVVDTGGPPRVMVGPVARGFEYIGALDQRLDNHAVAGLTSLHEPWAKSYTAPAPATPKLAVQTVGADPEANQDDTWLFAAQGSGQPGPVRIDLLDQHRQVVASGSARVGPRPTLIRVRPLAAPAAAGAMASMVRIRAGDFSTWVYDGGLYTSLALGGDNPIDLDKLAPQEKNAVGHSP